MTHKKIECLRKLTNLDLVTAYGSTGGSGQKHEIANEINFRIHLGTFKAPQGVYDYETYMNRSQGSHGVRDSSAPSHWELVHGGATYAQPSLFEWLTSVWNAWRKQ